MSSRRRDPRHGQARLRQRERVIVQKYYRLTNYLVFKSNFDDGSKNVLQLSCDFWRGIHSRNNLQPFSISDTARLTYRTHRSNSLQEGGQREHFVLTRLERFVGWVLRVSHLCYFVHIFQVSICLSVGQSHIPVGKTDIPIA